ncbi:hypothetical protein GQ457_02G042740 [Hibiscus cannabinus]
MQRMKKETCNARELVKWDAYALFLMSRNRGNRFGRSERGVGSIGEMKTDFRAYTLFQTMQIVSLGKARRQGGSSITFVQVRVSITFDTGIGTLFRVSVPFDTGISTLFRVSVPFDTGIGTTPLSTDTGTVLEQFYVLVPILAIYDFMSLNDSFESKFHTRAYQPSAYSAIICRPLMRKAKMIYHL